ncbi:MAG: asparagine synthase-related protein [Syntrophales bacterium]
MCGILNVISKRGRELDLSACQRALSLLTWRGPDLCTFETHKGKVFFGQTVLSITGDALGNVGENLKSVSGRFNLGFNGEIYNYRELTDRWLKDKLGPCNHGTDTEVLANLHEVLPLGDIPPLLDGMFTYSLLDTFEDALSICRDVQGEKTLYIYEDQDLIIISSLIGAIHALVPHIPLDVQALRDYFRTRHFMLIERTAYQGIRQLLPGTLETLNLKTMTWQHVRMQKISQWIDQTRMDEYAGRAIDSLTDELDALMKDCLLQMIPDERKYASVVSGGVDSSLISHYLVTHAHPEVLVAVNHVGKDRISDELSGFERVLGRDIKILHVDQGTYSSEIERCQRICGSPLLSHSFIGQAIQSSFVRTAGCRVLFGGDGGDELFGGYPAYVNIPFANGKFSPSPYTACYDSPIEFIEDDPSALQRDLSNAWKESCAAYGMVEDPVDQTALAMMYCDLTYQLPSVGLRGDDLMSMMWSIETRTVLLRKPIVKFALNLPIFAKADRRQETMPLLRAKPLLKRLFLRYYPEDLLVEKQGFAGFPNESGLYIGNPMDYMALDLLGMEKSHLANALSDRATAWKLINLEYFLRWNANAT